ncbi:DMT family transporter [Pseudonocardia tropica]|uniref:DMT family transporter n=1 Tax=Pseudonocardia tropica TaxID=681289 RepID=A0ABV1K1P3_9PSEU
MTARAWGLFAAVAVLWGVPYLFIGLALRDLGAMTVVAGRVVIGAMVLVPVVAWWCRPWPSLRGRWGRLVVVAVVEVAVPFTLIALGELTVASGPTGVIIATEPLFVLLIAWALRDRDRDRVPTRAWWGLAVGFTGVVALVGFSGAGAGVPLIVGAAASYALGAVLVGRWFADLPGLVVAAVMLLIAAVPCTVLAMLLDPAPSASVTAITAVVVLGAACTAVGFASFFALIASAGAARAALITYAAPVVATIAGAVVLDETVTLATLAAIALVLAGAVLATHRPDPTPGHRASEPAPEPGL